jgi:hypothetical protein
MKEGEGGILHRVGCPDHGDKFLYRKNIDGIWYELCSVQNCYYKDVVRRERRQRQPILFEDRRVNDT